MLRRKMFRDMRLNLFQFLTIFLMVLIGILVYTGIEGYMLGMEESANEYYLKNNLQDLDAYGKLYKEDVDKIKAISNVKNAEGKLTLLANNDSIDGHTLELNFIDSNEISKFSVIEGSSFKNESGIYIDSYYAKNNNINIGDIIKVSYNDLHLEEEVKGLIMVPDHVYDVKDSTEVLPSHLDYGFAYLSRDEIPYDYINKEFYKETGLLLEYVDLAVKPIDLIPYTSIMIDVNDKINKDDVRKKINEIDSISAVLDIEEEESFYQYKREQEEGESYIGIFSGLFIFIALLSVITTMTRLIRKERTEIGTLKALGFSNTKILIHYLSYGTILSILGTICGILIGYYGLGSLFMKMEMTRFELPSYHPGINSSVIFISIITILLIIIATYLSAKSILKENAADTLRPERPKIKRSNIRLKHGSFSTRWNIRDIIRNKIRTMMGLVGIAGCMILLVVGFGMVDTMNNFMHIELDIINNYKYKLNIDEKITDEELDNLYKEFNNNTSLTLGIEITLKDGSIVSNNLFVNDSNGLIKELDDNNQELILKDGVYITRKFAETNNYKVGDTIKWHIFGDEKIHESEIVGFNMDPQNQNMTMNKKTYEYLGYLYKPDSLYTKNDINTTNHYDGITTIQDISSISDGVNDMMELMKIMIYIMVLFAAVLGSVIIYNMGILSFSEKEYQFATLKVLGFSNSKISSIFIKQNIWITIIAIIVSIPLGYYITDYVFTNAMGDTYDFSVYITNLTYLISALGTFFVSMLVSLFLSRKINKIDMVKSLKGSE